MAWMTSDEALAALGVQPQTLYANVSRGRVRAKPDPRDARRSLYNGEDIKRMAARHAGRRASASIAAAAIGWGDPVLPSSISTIADGRLWYRGHDAIALSSRQGLEEVAGLLWQCEPIQFQRRETPTLDLDRNESALEAALIVLSRQAAHSPPCLGRTRAVLLTEAAELVNGIAIAMLGSAKRPKDPLHRRLATAWRAPEAEDILRRALVLLADHELNASTFASRIAASTGASLSACLLAGLATLAGPLHGGAAAEVRRRAAMAKQIGADRAVRDWLAEGRSLPGFGHPLYPEGDPRAQALLAHFKSRSVLSDLGRAAEALTGEQPNIDFAISAITDAFDLPPSAPLILFAIARSVGWIAHCLEQQTTGTLIRPRARYVGPPVVRQR